MRYQEHTNPEAMCESVIARDCGRGGDSLLRGHRIPLSGDNKTLCVLASFPVAVINHNSREEKAGMAHSSRYRPSWRESPGGRSWSHGVFNQEAEDNERTLPSSPSLHLPSPGSQPGSDATHNGGSCHLSYCNPYNPPQARPGAGPLGGCRLHQVDKQCQS